MNNKLISKLFKTTLILFFVLTIYTIPTLKKEEKVLRTNLEIGDVTDIPTTTIYLLDKNNFLVQDKIFIKTENKEEIVREIFKYLTKDNNDIPIGLNTYITKDIRIQNIEIENDLIKLDLSKELLNSENIETIIIGLTYSLIKIDGINNIKITVDNKPIDNYNKLLNKKLGINNNYSYTKRKDINKTVIYYLDNINENYYYVPVTKYLNDTREKIEIIIDELKNNDNNELISPLNNKTKLLNYKEESNVLFLNFNKYLLDKNDEMNDKIQDIIAYSAFDNYDVDMVMFEINGKELRYIKK